ncbi:WD repeat- and FYVE domain-containing protein 4-like [Sinocyclocheilus grahami]|uniref:WD repeat- and FYVE domain-containing protein 4-like n=1 Tax=Sinocyclocheilus grahami TaxID=75366 RepID=UPI0007AD322E|nr:PREDICTED: WD repeat- and FYVE domain-containing protein 4-like [Sinocyclocheilus grahami]
MIAFVRTNNCMKICIQNMHKISENIPVHVLAEVAVSVFSFVKDSYPVSPALFEEFENNDGYSIFQAILLRCEEQVTEEHFLAVQDLLGLIASFTLFGKAELKVAICVNNPQPPGFTFDPTLTNGSPVRNLTAFKIIQSSFLRSGNTVICGQILRTIQMIWSWEKANFFLLEWSLQSLAQLAECVWQKSAPVHLIFFELLETVIYQLSYIPHETIRKVQAVLKQGCSEAFNVAALDCFYGLIIHSGLLSEVLSDGGLMEQLLFELKRRAKIIRKAGVAVNEVEEKADNYERKLTTSILNVVAALALQSVRNTVFIRDLGMIPYVKIFLDVEQFRSPALCILEQLSEVNPEEYMSTAIGALCSSTESEIRLKQDLLQSIMKVLENPNSWNAFRTSGGFTGLLSIVVDMEGSLLEAPTGPWATLSRQSLVELLLLTLHTLALVVHVHPVNGHFFHTTGVCEKLGDALMQLGCFQRGVPVETDKESSDCRTFQEFVEAVERPEPQLPPPLGDCVKLLGFLEQFATSVSLVADPCARLHDNNDAGEIQRTGEPSNDDEALNHTRAASVSYVSTDSGRAYCDLTILHPGAVKLIMTLLPSIYCPSDPCLSEELQLAVAHHVQTLVKSERNRQIMCEFGLASTLLTHCKHILIDNSHSLHLPIVRILEKLASQSMDHKCLRQFLCLGDPLMCSGENRLSVSCEVANITNQTKDSVEDNRKSLKKAMKRSFSLLKTSSDSGTVVPLHRIISLVSITTPRSFQPHKVSISPSFVEFDMTDSGYGCLFLPSLATVKGVSADFISTGGLGTVFYCFVWQSAPENLDICVLNHFVDILKSSSGSQQNAEVMHRLNMMSKLLILLHDNSVTRRKVSIICTIIRSLLEEHFNTTDIKRIGLFLVHSLLPPTLNEKCTFSDLDFDDQSQGWSQTPGRSVWIRNQLLSMLSTLIISNNSSINQEEIFFALGSDWFLLFLQGHIHTSTVLLVLTLLTHFLSYPSILAKFREGVSPGTLVETMEMPTNITDNLKSRSWSFECLSCICPGFEVLQKLLVSHIHLPQVYGAISALLIGKPDFQVLAGQVDVDMMLQSLIDSCSDRSEGVQLCADAACVLLELIKVIITKPVTGSADGWEVHYPGSVMQFLCLVNSLFPQDPLWTSPDFLSSLASAVFPFETPESSTGVQGIKESGEVVGEPLLLRPSHPGRKQVCDFIRILLMDSLINIPVKDGFHPLIQLVEFSPDGVCQEHRQSFQTELLEFVMDIIHMTGQEEGQSTHVTRDDPSRSKQEGKAAVLVENVAFFSKMLVEKLYSGMYVVEPENLLVFMAEQIAVALEKGHGHREITVSILYKNLNRALLYFLSRPRQTPAEQELVVQTLRMLQQHWDVIMATYNANVHFIICLMHCLVLVRSGSFLEGFGCEVHKKPTRNIWRHIFLHKNNRVMSQTIVTDSAEVVESELMLLVESTWNRVMRERRQALEEAYKIDLSAKSGSKEGQVSMGDVSPLWEETAMKAWQLFIDSQKKKANNGHQKRAGFLSSALQSVQKRFGKDSVCTPEGFILDMEAHWQTCETIFDSMLRSHTQMMHSENDRMAIQWLRIEEDLLRERGLFGPGPGVFLKGGWVQNTAEGRNRTRSRIRRKQLRRSKKMPTLTSGLIQKNFVEESKGATEVIEADSDPRILCEPTREVEEEHGLDYQHLTFFPVLNEATPLPEDFSEQCMDTQLILKELEPTEEVKAKHCVVVVSGHVLTEGVLLFGKADLYICEGFTLTSTGDVCCRIHHQTNVRDSYVCNMMNKEKSSVSPSCKRWSYDDIKEANFMRFLLEDNALEIFLKNGTSVFLVFFNNDHVNAHKRLCSVVSSLKGRGETVLNVRKAAAVEKTALIKWQRGEVSNFEYLMHLNTLAGRTYNDLMQYPVFPWIIADYESEILDLSHPATFRDLSKPMGAQNEKRKEKFIQRYNEVESNDGDLSAQCHYCTHYSSAIIVASYLVRMEPFSQTFLHLQGGMFDVPERMFHSIQNEWESASKDNMSDVRELIPEFFYLPDFLVNSNQFDFGCMQDGTPLDDVVLPPWAKGDPQEFIRVHREALESDYVSARLHLWIDLIFGYKQQGPPTVEALNTFHPYFYTDKHDRASMKDPVVKSTVLGYISNFGQMPKQLFTKPHPSRTPHKGAAGKETSVSSQITPFFFKLDKLKPSAQAVKELTLGPVGQIVCREKDVLVVEKNKLLIPPHWNTYFSWGSYDQTCSFGSYTAEKNFAVCESLSDWGYPVCAACPNNSTIITAGTSTVVCVWDVSISKDKLKHMRLRQTLYGHTDTVTCLVASEAHSMIISGSLDQTCILWDLEDLSYITQLPEHSSAVSALAINDLTGEIVSCAGTHLNLWTMKGQLLASLNTSCRPEGNILCCCFTQKYEWDPRNVIITGSADGIVRIWKTEYTRAQLPGHEECSVSQGHVLSSAPEEADSSSWKWERHLVLCQELNRNQVVSRQRCKNNPAITALGISRTHGTLLVGDAWGRVYSWS